MQKLVGRANTVEAFKETFAATKEAEMLMLARHSRMTESDRLNIARNSKTIEEAFQQNGFGLGEVVALSEISQGAFEYAKPPFTFVVARDRAGVKVVWFSFVTQ